MLYRSRQEIPAGLALKLSAAPGFQPNQPLAGVIELTDKSGATQALALTAQPGAPLAPTTSLPTWAVLAFLGGLILNLMPCVFPILAMKALALIRLGGAAHNKIRREALAYTAGVLAAFLLLAGSLLILRSLGTAAGWGFQFQSPVFVALIAWLILAAALNLAGVFEITGFGNFGARLAAQNSFFTGLLAVVVATPCTAPFMGGAVAAALAAPPAAALTIFLALALGLAAPFLLLALVPGLAQLLPRPGAWMRLLQRGLAIPMFLTFAWLAWVFLLEAGAPELLLLLLGAAFLYLALSRRRLRLLSLAALLILPFLHPAPAGASLTLSGAEAFSQSRLTTLRAAGTPVFVDLTAAWCVTCLVNDHTTLTTAAVQSAFATHHVQILLGDWTNRDPALTAFLQSHHRAGVPLYLYFPANGDAEILPQILTPGIVLAALH